MKQIHIFILFLIVFLSGCSNLLSPNTADLQKYIGVHETADDSPYSYLEIYDVTDAGEIFFQVGWWIDEWGSMEAFGGVGTQTLDTVDFSVSVDTLRVTGTFSLKKDAIHLSIVESDLDYLPVASQYTYTFSNAIPKDSTNHEPFEIFLANHPLPDYDSWEYCGQTTLIFKKPNQEYPEWFELYKVKTQNTSAFYVVSNEFSNDRSLYEVYGISTAGSLNLLFSKKDFAITGIPKLHFFSNQLDIDFETLKKRRSHDLFGPTPVYRTSSESLLGLDNINSLDCYIAAPSTQIPEFIGVENNEIQFHGYYTINTTVTSRVKAFLPDAALSIDPAIYPIKNNAFPAGTSAYVWQLDNAFLVLNTANETYLPWYDRMVYSVVYVRDIDYLDCFE